MLRFVTPLTPAAGSFVRGALEIACYDLCGCHISTLPGAADAEEGDLWETNYEEAARLFSPELAAVTLSDVWTKLEAPEEYIPTDYHWLLLHSVLSTVIEYLDDGMFADFRRELLALRAPGSDYFLGERGSAALSAFTEAYFWDTDFLSGGEDLAFLAGQQRESLDISSEAFGISQGLNPHPDELAMKRVSPADER